MSLESTRPAMSFRGTHIEELSAFYAQYGGAMTARLNEVPSSSFDWNISLTANSTAQYLQTLYNADWASKRVGDVDEYLTIISPIKGSVTEFRGQRAFEAGPGSVLLSLSERADGYRSRGQDHDSRSLIISRERFNKVLVAHLDGPLSSDLDLLPLLDLTSRPGQTMASFISAISEGMRDNGPLLHAPLAMESITDGLLTFLLETVPHRYSQMLQRGVRPIAPRQVRRAIEYMHQNLDKPITRADIALAGEVSIRALEEGFRRFEGIPPMAYLRLLRLNAARSELAVADEKISVHDVARKWGFSHLGRFSGLYKSTFGELPSETLRRAWSRAGIID